MSHLVVGLVVAVALGAGGYDPWASLTLEVGALALGCSTLVAVLWGTHPEEKRYYLQQRQSRRKLPFLARHPRLGLIVRGCLRRGSRRWAAGSRVEILPPGAPAERIIRRADSYWILAGYPFPRTGVGLPVLLLTVWILLSLVPLNAGLLSRLSPRAYELHMDVVRLTSSLRQQDAGCWSLAPYVTARDLWLWAAYLMLFYTGVGLAGDPRNVERISRGLFFAAVGFGLYGMSQWLMGLQELFGADASRAGLRASASFGNRNHYAAFMEMLLLCGLGWLASRWTSFINARKWAHVGFWRRVNTMAQEAGAKLFLTALGIMVLGTGLVFSLSRSGVTFGLVGCAVFALMAPRQSPERTRAGAVGRRHPTGATHLLERAGASHLLLALGLVLIGICAWIGLDPIVHRFQLLPEEWEAESGRWQVWLDSRSALKDFLLTGSGLGSFRYVFPMYRSFGGIIYYSWAHNDYLQALLELGIPGLALVVLAMGAVWHRARFVRRHLIDAPGLLALHAGYSAAAVAIALHSATDFALHMPANAALIAIVVGVVVGMERCAPAPVCLRESTGRREVSARVMAIGEGSGGRSTRFFVASAASDQGSK